MDYSLKIISLAESDLEVRERLAKTGELFDGYNAEMEKVHLYNADELLKIIDEIGWPTKEKVGADANRAAWLIVQHAISLPHFQRKCLVEIEKKSDSESKLQYAYLYDRIKFNERRPQRFGTQFDWDENGEFNVWKIENPEIVDELRRELQLPSLKEQTEIMRDQIRQSGEQPPENYAQRQQEIFDWALKTGWISENKIPA